jgi:ribosomal protein S18 acetylase RimI-like enzyme
MDRDAVALRPARSVWLDDIFVDEPARGRGVGRRLLVAVAAVAVNRGARSVWWGVRSSNHRARAYYAKLGATDDNARILELNEPALSALAAECPSSP